MKVARYIANVVVTLVLGDLLARQIATSLYLNSEAIRLVKRLRHRRATVDRNSCCVDRHRWAGRMGYQYRRTPLPANESGAGRLT
jgi:hypothetical protein